MPSISSKLKNRLIKPNVSMTKYSRGKLTSEDSKGLIRRFNLETDRTKQWIKRTNSELQNIKPNIYIIGDY
jgi:hypothetical protein